MKKLLLLSVLGLVACKEMPAGNSSNPQTETSAPYNGGWSETKTVSLEGQIYYSLDEIVNGEETDTYLQTQLAEYELSQVRVYLVGSKRIYKAFPDYDGVFFQENMVPGNYKVIVKTPEKFQDQNGSYTYQAFSTVKVGEGENKMGIINVKKVRLTTESNQVDTTPTQDMSEEDMQMINEGELQ